MPCDERERVIIRVWTSQLNQQYRGENVGHVSIETISPASYMSLWPSRRGKTQGRGLFKPIEHQLMPDYSADEKAEGRAPEVTLCFYSLNTGNIETSFQSVSNDPDFQGWALIGNNRLVNQGNAHSCASLAYHLLKAGGIYDLVASLFSSKFSSVVSPDDLLTAVTSAKRQELREYPETREFTFEGETVVEPASPNRCAIL